MSGKKVFGRWQTGSENENDKILVVKRIMEGSPMKWNSDEGQTLARQLFRLSLPALEKLFFVIVNRESGS